VDARDRSRSPACAAASTWGDLLTAGGLFHPRRAAGPHCGNDLGLLLGAEMRVVLAQQIHHLGKGIARLLLAKLDFLPF